MSGVELVIRPEVDNIGDRIVSIKTLNKATGIFEDMDMDEIYTLAVTSYIVPKGRIKSILGFFPIVGSFGRTKSQTYKILLIKLSAK